MKNKRVPFSRMHTERIIEMAGNYSREYGGAGAPRRFAAFALWSTYGDQWVAYRSLVDKEYMLARIGRYDIASHLNTAAKIIASDARQGRSISRKISSLFPAIVAIVTGRRPPAS